MTEWQWGQLVTIATVVASFFVSEWRAARARRWEKEDRVAAAQRARDERDAATDAIVRTAKAEAEVTRIKQEAEIARLKWEAALIAERLRLDGIRAAVIVDERTTNLVNGLHTAIAEVKNDAKIAYTEANNMNKKIELITKSTLSSTG